MNKDPFDQIEVIIKIDKLKLELDQKLDAKDFEKSLNIIEKILELCNQLGDDILIQEYEELAQEIINGKRTTVKQLV